MFKGRSMKCELSRAEVLNMHIFKGRSTECECSRTGVWNVSIQRQEYGM